MQNQHIFTSLNDVRRAITRYLLVAAIFVRSLDWRTIRIAAVATVAVLIVALNATFYWPHTVNFAYGQENCFVNPVVLPGLVKTESTGGFAISLKNDLSVGGFGLYSHSTCVTPTQAPQANSTAQLALAPFGNGVVKKNVSVHTGALPTVASLVTTPTVSPHEHFMFKLDQADSVFSYQLVANNNTVACSKQPAESLACPLAELKLAQSSTYPVVLERTFNGQGSEQAYTGTLVTTDALYVTATSIDNGQKVFTLATSAQFTFNKTVRESTNVGLVRSDTQEVIPVTATHTNNIMTVNFSAALPRGIGYTLTIGEAIAEDGGYLNAPYTLSFSMSGGPQVAGVSIGTYKVATNASIRLTFDSPLAAGQDLLHYIRVKRAAGQMDASYSLSGKIVTVAIKGGMPACTAFSIEVLDGLKSDIGIKGGNKTWTYNSRTICQQTFSIGTSERGRSITAYKFGSGAQKVVFVGAIHGNEHSARYILTSLIDYLEANIGAVPASRTVIIIPNANPDGTASGSRFNANGVNLNRNFPANNWKPNVTESNGSYLPYGGGTAPLSERESAAIAEFLVAQSPVMVMSYHAAATLVAANESGNSLSLAKTYAKKVGYPAAQGNEAAGAFAYDTTGAMEDWLHDKHNLPCILVELRNKSSNEFSAHRAGMLYIIQS